MSFVDTLHMLKRVFQRDGWHIAECECGWEGPPSPTKGMARSFHQDHRAGDL